MMINICKKNGGHSLQVCPQTKQRTMQNDFLLATVEGRGGSNMYLFIEGRDRGNSTRTDVPCTDSDVQLFEMLSIW